jgi:tryptophan 2,3-dioxygenase
MRQIEILFGLEESERIPLGPVGSHMDALRGPDGESTSALERVEAALEDLPSLRGAVYSWLYRTPIDGTAHDAHDADARLQVFVDRFLEAHGREVRDTCERAVGIATSDEEVARLRARYAAEQDGVRAFLLPESGDRRLTRVRASMLFIETYRDLPLLAWPREILAALLRFEQAFLIFRQRHARMVELVIGRRIGTGGSSGVDYLDQTALSYRVFRDLWAIRTLMIRPAAAPPLDNPEFYGFRSGV